MNYMCCYSCQKNHFTIVSSPILAGGASANVVSLTAVVDALESQRRELSARNKELELQVRDLLAALKKQANSSSGQGGGRRNCEEEEEARRSSTAHR